MMRVAVAVVALLLVGGAAGEARAAGGEARAAGDEARAYDLHNQDAKRPAPLIVALQCYGCAPSQVPQTLGLEELARRHQALLAIPIALTDRHGSPFWNATPACCDFDGRKPDDVGYIAHVIDDAVKKHGADPKQVYLVGMSNGGFLAYRVACERSPKIAAIVSVGGAAPAVCKPTSPVAVLEVHGRGDGVVPLAGGTLGAGLPQQARIPSARETLDLWARVDGCGAPDANGRRRCDKGAADLWLLPGGHVPELDGDFAEQLWQWLAAHRK